MGLDTTVENKIKERRWRFAHGRHYYEDDRFGYAYVDKRAVRSKWEFWATVPGKGSGSFRLLREAKAWCEARA